MEEHLSDLDELLPAVDFDPALEVSPFALFRRLREGRPPVLVDLRAEPSGLTLAGALPDPGAGWRPPPDVDVVLFDGGAGKGEKEGIKGARAAARRLQAAGFSRVRALYGGLALYDFALDPEVVGAERFLVPVGG